MPTWEIVKGHNPLSDDIRHSVYRLEVPGGWIYKYSECIAFVPDPKTVVNTRKVL